MSGSAVTVSKTQSHIDLDALAAAEKAVIVTVAGAKGISGFVFDIDQEENIQLQADITDHYTENGSYINDHIVLKPVEITLGGLIGELVYTGSLNDVEYTADKLANALSSVTAYTSIAGLTAEAAQKVAAITTQVSYVANQVSSIQKKATSLISVVSGKSNTETLQQAAYKKIYALWKSKQIVSVQTPWQYFDTMGITTVSASHDDTTNDYTIYSISLKELRFADTTTTQFDSSSFSAFDASSATTKDEGKVSGSSSDFSTSFLDQWFYGGK